MRDSFLSRFGIFLVIVVAFVDGILVANHFSERIEKTEAKPAVQIEDIFALYEDPVVEEQRYEEIPTPEPREVPFTSQAPSGDWGNPWGDFAEEAVMVMVRQWDQSESILSSDQAELMMEDIARYESSRYGDAVLASIAQVHEILDVFFGIKSEILENPSTEDIITVLEDGGVIVAPVNGQILLNPHYGNPAPEHHMILIHSWESGQFITHDPGTRHGENYPYDQQKILESIQDLDGVDRILIIQP